MVSTRAKAKAKTEAKSLRLLCDTASMKARAAGIKPVVTSKATSSNSTTSKRKREGGPLPHDGPRPPKGMKFACANPQQPYVKVLENWERDTNITVEPTRKQPPRKKPAKKATAKGKGKRVRFEESEESDGPPKGVKRARRTTTAKDAHSIVLQNWNREPRPPHPVLLSHTCFSFSLPILCFKYTDLSSFS